MTKITCFFLKDYRLSKFCGERIKVGNENTPKETNEKGEPKAEARIQGEPSAHNLTIFKQSILNSMEPRNASNTRKLKPGQIQQVFSQVRNIFLNYPQTKYQ